MGGPLLSAGRRTPRRVAAVLDEHIQGRRYIVGSSLTLADLTLASSLMYAQQADAPLVAFPNIQAPCSRISDTESPEGDESLLLDAPPRVVPV